MPISQYRNLYGEDRRMYSYRREDPIQTASCMFFRMSGKLNTELIEERMVDIVKDHYAFSTELHPTKAKWRTIDPMTPNNYVVIVDKPLTLKEAFAVYVKANRLIYVVCNPVTQSLYTFADHTICDGVRAMDVLRRLLDPSPTNQSLKLPEIPRYYPLITEAGCLAWAARQLRLSCRGSQFKELMFDEEMHMEHHTQVWQFEEIKTYRLEHKMPTMVVMLLWYLWPLFQRYPGLTKLSVCTIGAFDPPKNSYKFNWYGFCVLNITRESTKDALAQQILRQFNRRKADFVHSLQFMRFLEYLPGAMMESLTKKVRENIDLCFTSVPVAKGTQSIGGIPVAFHGGGFGYMTSPLYALALTHGSEVFVTTSANVGVTKWEPEMQSKL
jgi:hypothetical protein